MLDISFQMLSLPLRLSKPSGTAKAKEKGKVTPAASLLNQKAQVAAKANLEDKQQIQRRNAQTLETPGTSNASISSWQIRQPVRKNQTPSGE